MVFIQNGMNKWIHLESIDSTNAYLQRLQLEGEDIAGFVVWTEFQTLGKGLGKNNTWESERGKNLTFSLAFDMAFMQASDQFLLSQAVPLGIINILDRHLPPQKLFVKWPNDICFDGGKLGGILINSTISGNKMGIAVIGIGLNVNQTTFSDLPTHPVSLCEITKAPWDKEALLHELVESIRHEVLLLKDRYSRELLHERYLQRLFRFQEWGDYEVNGQRLHLFLDGTDTFGRLLLHDTAGNVCVYEIKQIRFLM